MSLPALVPAGALLAGAGLAAAVDVPPVLPAAAVTVVAAAAAALVASRDRPAASVACVAIACAAAGCALLGLARGAAERSPLRLFFDEVLAGSDLERSPALVEGRLARDATPAPYGASLAVTVERIEAGGQWFAAPGGLRASVTGDFAPGRIDEWRAGRRVRMPVTLRRPGTYYNPGARDLETDLNRRGTALVGSVKSALLVDVTARGTLADETAAAARALVRRAVRDAVSRFDERSGAVVSAILIGDRGGLTDEARRRLQEAGTYHVIAISGGNIAILVGLIVTLLRLVRAAWRPAALCTMVALVAYAMIVVDEPSVVRATTVAIAYLSAHVLDHRTPPLNALFVAAAVILAATPLSVYDAGFALSFGATAGILVGASPMAGAIVRRVWRRHPERQPPRWLAAGAALLAATIASELALLPTAAWFFSRVTLAGLLLNFIAIPLMTIVQVAGLVTVALAVVAPPAAIATGAVAHVAVVGLVESARLVDLAPWLTWRVPAPPGLLLTLYYGAWLVRLAAPARRRRAIDAAIVAVGLCVVAAPPALARLPLGPLLPRPCLPSSVPGRLQVAFLDVGQADATLVRFPDGRSMLVDAGGTPTGSFDVGGRVVAPAVWALGVRRLDVLVITHGHPDHAGGAVSVIRDFRPREVWEGVTVTSDELMARVAAEAGRAGARWRVVRAGERYAIGGATVHVLHPPEPDWERPHVRNDDSVVLDIRYGGVSVVLPGDVGREIERDLLPQMAFDGRRVLKAAHHGSATSSAAPFIAAADPDFVVFSAGRDNRFGHPPQPVVQRYQNAGVTMLRTDRHGAIAIATDGRTLDVATCLAQFRVQRSEVQGSTGNREPGTVSFVRPPARSGSGPAA